MLLGRTKELARIDEVLAEAAAGHSSALVVRGEAGVGKTSLLAYASAEAASTLRLRARGIESESEIAFSGLLDLLRPVVDLMESLPGPQYAALAGALAMGPPVGGDRFTIYAACLGLLASAAERSPVTVLVDDLQWLDPSSSEALLFAARRFEAEEIAMIFTVREGERDLDIAGLDELMLPGLDAGDARLLLEAHTVGPISPAVADLLIKETRGNPLALNEVVRVLKPEHLSGKRALELPLPVGPSLEKALLARIEGFPRETRQVLLVAAASDNGAMDEVVAALKDLDLDRDALDAAEEVGIVRIDDGRLAFDHPLMRSAVYHGAAIAERRRCHRALADSILRADRRAWQLAAASDVPDEEIAVALEEAASDASARGGYAAAAAALEKAARLTPDDVARARRLLAAASSYYLAGRSAHPLELLEEALAFSSDSILRADIQHVRGTVLFLSGAPFVAADLLASEAEAIAAASPDKAVLMLADASFAYHFTSRVPLGVGTAQRAFDLAPEGPLRAAAGLNLAAAILLEGRLEESSLLFERYIPAVDMMPPPMVWRSKAFVAQSIAWLGEYERAQALVDSSISSVRLAGAPAPLPYALAVDCEVRYRTGDWARAYASGTEGARLGFETGQEAMAACNLITVGRIYAARGQAEEALATGAQALELTDRLRTESLRVYIASFLGLLELTRGRAESAVEHLETARRTGSASGLKNPDVVHFWADLVEALLQAGRLEEARKTSEQLASYAEMSGSALTRAFAARCRGLLDDTFEPGFQEALQHHELSANPYEKARTLLLYGERLRRSNRRAEARERLRAARTIFAGLEATPWAQRAEAELAATGERLQRAAPTGSVRLTPQELQVALAVAAGATNREAASALFLSPKTIEFHLSNVYSKLGIRSRSALAARVAEGALAQPE